MPKRSRADIIAGLQETVDKYGAETTATGAPKVTVPIVKPAPKQTIEPAEPVKPKKEKTYIPPNLRGEDRRWLQEELKPPTPAPKKHHSAPMGKFWEKRAKKL